ncbi:MAG: hypothetical protein P8Q39_03465, partial [Candidatus Thalassarchaeaceae archaeon]|nr:hypothetical protein [Candidatus Thalassarchaeaceae archaeon]
PPTTALPPAPAPPPTPMEVPAAPAPPPPVAQPSFALDEMPPPPPPVGAGQMAPDPFAPQVAKEPSSFEVEAAPREEAITPDEAIDLLNDLSE